MPSTSQYEPHRILGQVDCISRRRDSQSPIYAVNFISLPATRFRLELNLSPATLIDRRHNHFITRIEARRTLTMAQFKIIAFYHNEFVCKHARQTPAFLIERS